MAIYLLLCLSVTLVGGDGDTKDNVTSHDNKSSEGESTCNFMSCCSDDKCKCTSKAPHYILECTEYRNLSILDCYCATFDGADRLCVGQCIFGCTEVGYNGSPYYEITGSNNLCTSHNRTGMLCGACKDGHYPLAYSFDMNCVQCPNGKENWWKFALAAILPLTIFYFIVLLLKINLTTSRLNVFVFFSQAITAPQTMRSILLSIRNLDHKLQTVLRYAASLYGVWNLDFFRSFDLHICLGTDTLQTLALDIVVGVYPLLLMVLTYLLIELHDRNFRPVVTMWRPLGKISGLFRKNWDIRTSLIDAFATFFFLSNIKFMSISFDLLVPVKIYHLNSTGNYTYTFNLFYDATMPYFGQRHLPYGILGLTVLVFALSPVLLLVLYPFRCFQKFLNLFPVRWYILHTFMDSFHGCYKNGTEPGTRDCRWFASVYFIIRFIFMVLGAYTMTSSFFTICAIGLVLMCLLIVLIQPFKADMQNLTAINVVFVLFLALWYVLAIYIIIVGPQITQPYYAVIGLSLILPMLYVSTIALHWMYRNRRFGSELIRRLHTWRHGYEILR